MYIIDSFHSFIISCVHRKNFSFLMFLNIFRLCSYAIDTDNQIYVLNMKKKTHAVSKHIFKRLCFSLKLINIYLLQKSFFCQSAKVSFFSLDIQFSFHNSPSNVTFIDLFRFIIWLNFNSFNFYLINRFLYFLRKENFVILLKLPCSF